MTLQNNKKTTFATPMLPVAWGEVFDKLTILEIKCERLVDAVKQNNVIRERNAITQVIGDRMQYPEVLGQLIDQLKTINGELWDIEEGKRDCERQKIFDDRFIYLARQVYIGNDKRATIKRAINELLGSELKEEKSYAAY